jgi:hypothetical protein
MAQIPLDVISKTSSLRLLDFLPERALIPLKYINQRTGHLKNSYGTDARSISIILPFI